MKSLIVNLSNGDMLTAKQVFEEKMAITSAKKLLEVKKMIASRIDEAKKKKEESPPTFADYHKVADELSQKERRIINQAAKAAKLMKQGFANPGKENQSPNQEVLLKDFGKKYSILIKKLSGKLQQKQQKDKVLGALEQASKDFVEPNPDYKRPWHSKKPEETKSDKPKVRMRDRIKRWISEDTSNLNEAKFSATSHLHTAEGIKQYPEEAARQAANYHENIFASPSINQDEKTFTKHWINKPLNESIKGWKNAHSDIMKSREKSKQSSQYKVHRLKNNGELSGMHDASKYFSTEDDAIKYIENIKKLNPGLSNKVSHAIFNPDGKEIGRK